MGTMILKGGGVGRGWSQFSLISQSSLESRKSRSLGVSSLSVSVPQCGGCVPVCWGVPQCKRVFPSVGQCVLVCEGVSLCVRVCPSVGGCVPLWIGVSLCVRVCPSMGVCAAVWEGVSHAVREGLPQRRRVGGMCMCVCMCLCHVCSWGVRNVYKCTCA